jgi:hypothetical protein
MDSVIKVILACFLFFGFSFAQKIEGIHIPQTCAKLPLNGAGIRSKFFFDLYIGALYLSKKSSNAKNIIQKDEKMSIKLIILSSMITSKKMENATRDGFNKAMQGNTTALRKEIEDFIAVFKEKIKKEDVYDLVYTPKVGVDIYKNEKYKKTIQGLAFKKALFKIWLGEAPVQKSLKNSMLGKQTR